jgi:hypothetical protein
MLLWLLPSLILTLNRDVGLWQILLQKSFCVTEDKFSEPYAQRSNNYLRDYIIQR